MTSTPDHPLLPAVNSAEAGLSERQSNRIPGHKVFVATENLPEEQKLAVRWLHSYYYDSGRSLSEIGAEVGYDAGTISKVFNNKYEGNFADVVKSITSFRTLAEERASVNRAPYIKTNLYREIEECCQAALTYQKMVYLYGESQVGKTGALRHYAQEHNHGQTIFVTMPVGGSLTHFLAALAGAVRMTNCARGEILAMNIMKCFGPNNVLIIDEMSRALQAKSYGGSNLKTMDFIRDLHDQTGCGVVLCGTNVFRDQMADVAMKKFLNQFNRRALLRRQLPDVPSRADLNAFARHYELSPASGDAYALQSSVVRQHGLGVWLTTLMAASRKASKERKAMTWEHVVKAHAFFKRMEEPTHQEE
jgi:DNA transposition AAA+ family ATPase